MSDEEILAARIERALASEPPADASEEERKAWVQKRSAENRARYDAAFAEITPADCEALAMVYEEILGTPLNGDSTGLRAPWEWAIHDKMWSLVVIARQRREIEELKANRRCTRV